MASGGKESPDVSYKRFYKCHPKKELTTVICLLCENAYHQSDFDRLNNTVQLSELFVICPEHQDLKLTSKTDDVSLDIKARKIIAQVYLKRKEQIKQEILEEVANETNNPNQTLEDDATELEVLRKENVLLKQLISEMKDKNLLLKDSLNEAREERNKPSIQDNKTSYAQIVSTEKIKPKKISKIIIKKKNPEDKSYDLKQATMHYLTKKKSIQTKNVIFKNNQEAIIHCISETSAQEAEKIFKEKLSTTCTINKEETKKPRLKIVGVNNFENMNLKALEQDINERNFNDLSTGCTIVHKYQNSRTNLEDIIIEVPSEAYKRVKDNGSRIFIGFQNCRAYDDINVKPCLNCGRFGHSTNKCRNEKMCLRCSEPHSSVNCKNKSNPCCINCVFHNNMYKTNYNVQHVANDTQLCQVFKHKINKHIEATEYPIAPTIPRFIGNVDTVRTSTEKITKAASNVSLGSILSISPRRTTRTTRK